MKVAFVITGLNMGGAEIMLLKLLENSPELRGGAVISLRPGGQLLERFVALGVEVRTLGMRSGLPDPRKLYRLARMLRELRPDVVSTWMHHADLLGGLAARLTGLPVVWGIHSSDLSPRGLSFGTRVVLRLNAMLARSIPIWIISCSERAKVEYERAGFPPTKILFVPNGFDTEQFRPDASANIRLRRSLGLPFDSEVVGLIARIDPLKNHRGFLDAAVLVARARPDARFVLIGSGASPDNVELSGWVDERGLLGKVTMLGLRHDVDQLIPGMDVVALASKAEAFPLVLGEAMSCGVPCVTTDVGDSASIVGAAGVVVPVDDVVAMAEGIIGVLALPREARSRLGEQARSSVVERLDIRRTTRRYEEILADAARSVG